MADLSANMVKFLNDTLGIWYLIILNAFGVIAIIVKTTEYQLKSRKKILLFAFLAECCWIFYFSLQGDFTSALVLVVGVVQLLVFMQRGKYKWVDSIWCLIAFLVIQVTMAILTFKVWHDIFSISAGIMAAIAYYVTDKKIYRYISVVLMSCWVANSISKLYIVALLNDSFALVSVIISVIRFNIVGEKRKKSNTLSKNVDIDNTK